MYLNYRESKYLEPQAVSLVVLCTVPILEGPLLEVLLYDNRGGLIKTGSPWDQWFLT